jgi:hypothetical protein
VRRERLRVQQVLEDLRIQQLVPEATVEALAVAVLPRRARLDVQRLDLRRLQEPPRLRRDELRTVVAALLPEQMPRYATRPDRRRQKITHLLARHRTATAS